MSRTARMALFAGVLAFTAALAFALRSGIIVVPARWNPWAPLQIAAPPNWLTRFKLSRLDADARQCRALLAQNGMQFEELEDRETGPGCGFTNAVLVRRTATFSVEEFSLTCRTAVSLALWEVHSLQPAAQRHLGQPVERVEHFGSYACRNVYGRPAATRSHHATAEAWDVAGFVLADGRRIRIARDWQGTSAEALFLREARDGACRFFDGVLSPDYNAAHHDHLHLDRGRFRLCR